VLRNPFKKRYLSWEEFSAMIDFQEELNFQQGIREHNSLML